MIDWFYTLSPRRLLFAIFVSLVFLTSTVEIVSEFAAGESVGQMLDDIGLFLLSIVVVVLFIIDYLAQQKALGELRGQLSSARGQLTALDANSRQIANQYRQVMQKQFDVWQLTPSEQDVALGLLKGLSFREIAELRDTREKTVRQQATGVYRKAGVAGRHELAAWFFEDMLDAA